MKEKLEDVGRAMREIARWNPAVDATQCAQPRFGRLLRYAGREWSVILTANVGEE